MKPLSIALYYSDIDKIPQQRKTINAPLWVLSYLADALVKRGHKVTLFGAPEFKTKAKIHTNKTTDWSKFPELDKLKENEQEAEWAHKVDINDQTHVIDIYNSPQKFDIVHSHNKVILPIAALNPSQLTLVTHHAPYDKYYENLFSYYQKNFINIFFSALSKAHQNQAKKINFSGIVHNGIDIKKNDFNTKPKKGLLFVGRVTPEKGADRAVSVAKKTKKILSIIGTKYYAKPNQKNFWNKSIEPFLDDSIKYLGLINHNKLAQYYKNARVFLFPDNSFESFGLTPIEAMSCGTPVVAFNQGAIPSIVIPGETGFIVKNEKEMIKAVEKIYAMPEKKYIEMRYACKKHVENIFSIEKMAQEYEKLYYKIISKHE